MPPPRRTAVLRLEEPDGLVCEVPCRRLFHHRGVEYAASAGTGAKTEEPCLFPASTLAADLQFDWVAQEEPLELRVQGFSFGLLMRSPGDDIDLATGHVISEGIARGEDIQSVRHSSVGQDADNVVLVTLQPGVSLHPDRHARRQLRSSSCGLCGKTHREAALDLAPALDPTPAYPVSAATSALQALVTEQRGFSLCGGLHAVGLVDDEGRLLAVREDVGRHNALDKVIGFAHRERISLRGHALLLSGRCSFEMVQKALAARCETVIAIGAVSTLAVAAAERANMTLVGFARGGKMNIYNGALR